MKEFMLAFRIPTVNPASEADIQTRAKDWEEWIAGIAAQGKFIGAKRLKHEGRVLRTSGVITDGPFVELKEQLGGYTHVKAENLDDATTLAHGCPIFLIGGSVEIKEIV